MIDLKFIEINNTIKRSFVIVSLKIYQAKSTGYEFESKTI